MSGPVVPQENQKGCENDRKKEDFFRDLVAMGIDPEQQKQGSRVKPKSHPSCRPGKVGPGGMMEVYGPRVPGGASTMKGYRLLQFGMPDAFQAHRRSFFA